MSELVTICIPTFRRPSLVLHCIHSCLIQDYRPLEIDISDNSPTDETRDLVATISPPEGVTIRYWRNIPPTGPNENFRKLFTEARAPRLVLMNDDDVLLPGAVRAMSDAFSLAQDVVITYGLEQIINEMGELLPDATAQINRFYLRTPDRAGLRRDLLVCAFWRQVPHVGFMVLTEVARRIGIRDRSEVGLAVDIDFTIRLAQAYRGNALVFLDRPTVQSRGSAVTLNQTSLDVIWKLYDVVAPIDGLSPEEALAHDHLLRTIAPLALREHALSNARGAALRILLSRTFPRNRGWARTAYYVGLIAAPGVASWARRMAGTRLAERGNESSPTWRGQRATLERSLT
ncbi:MAG TPA: glycosyltransferase family 2 protein [Acetobacteraceae bacterium]|nr:glycosyltransferase family 2 protein [Acetobacteraceae bacterium]